MHRTKTFCIGFNKTGTTSLEKFMSIHGFRCGDQRRGELLMTDYTEGRWQGLKDLVDSADFFQDLPFSAPGTFRVLDETYPGSRFILTLRDSPEQWYRSLVEFHRRVFGRGERIPTRRDLETADYRYPGFAWQVNRALYDSPSEDPYRREDLIAAYENHRREVLAHFRGRKNLLTLEISDPKAVDKLADFLNIEPRLETMPWLNKTEAS